MAFIDWDDSYSIAIPFFDEEHKAMFALANDLYEAASSEVETPDLERICDRLIEHVVMHFRHEEMYFEDWQYPERTGHTAAHRTLRRQLFGYREQLRTNPEPEHLAELFQNLKLWLVRHILDQDVPYGAFLIERGLR